MNHSHVPRLLTNFTLRCVHFYPGLNSRAELVTLAPGLYAGTALRAVGSGIIIIIIINLLEIVNIKEPVSID